MEYIDGFRICFAGGGGAPFIQAYKTVNIKVNQLFAGGGVGARAPFAPSPHAGTTKEYVLYDPISQFHGHARYGAV